MTLQNKIVLITDADSPSVKTLINRLADEGAHFILNSASGGERIQSNIAYCKTQGSRTIVANNDLCNSFEVNSLLEMDHKIKQQNTTKKEKLKNYKITKLAHFIIPIS